MIHIKCPKCSTKFRRSKKFAHTIKKCGFYKRKSDRKYVQRYYCKACAHHFSCATFANCFNQKKRHINAQIERVLSAAVSLRESARILNINRKTIHRRLVSMGREAEQDLKAINKKLPKATEVTYDDLETFEHTKCKPVSIECPYYLNHIKEHFPKACHETFKGRASAIVGQGELKKVGFDPLFSINHTCATLRYRTSRLIRRTWNTTKKVERLRLHLAIVCRHHNRNLKKRTRPSAAG